MISEKNKLFLIILATILIVTAVVIKTGQPPTYKKGTSAVSDTAVAWALDLYKIKVVEGIQMTNGPCLTNSLMPGWVVDIVHSPREEIDDQPENECPAYLEGKANHFVELDVNGNLVRVR